MRHLGILGHSTEGAALCFRAFCQRGFRELGEHQHPDVTLDCIALARSMPGWDSGDHAAVRGVLAESVRRLAGAGSEFFVCADNTAHMALEAPGEPLALPGLHLPDVVAARAARDGRRRVGVLGTRYTMDGPLYPTALGRLGIEAAIPESADRALIHRTIFDELLNGEIEAASQEAFAAVIGRLAERGCDAVALVCTEIPLLVTPEMSPLPLLDSTRLLADAAFEVAVGRASFPAWRGGPVQPPG
ncbi:aspartate/glutamate racemase family protein [Streptomyces profundus]|uniref:aspartate/glutamate racemase family protein n=1 Tax=Streptomyces profundus TaxID=2867410 RepID=UPI001D160AF4|nr:amino acid racemase [Streptomyces sp. MA3_2.13]UED85561.1 amino acid racemase [Streptomyces sp. MA3_2.13]